MPFLGLKNLTAKRLLGIVYVHALSREENPMHLRRYLDSYVIRLCVILAIVLSTIPAVARATGADVPNAYVTATDVVNIRICPATDCAIVTSAKLGEPVNVIGNPVNGYLPVDVEGKRGFAFALFITDQVEDTWFTQGVSGCKRVAFIFDIGIGDTPSQSVIDTLVSKQVPATMFVMGEWATSHPEFLRQLDAKGFPIGTHGNTATYLTDATDAQVKDEIIASRANISAVIGNQIIPWATPYAADTDPRTRRLTANLGFVPVGWTVAAADYDETATANDVYARVVEGVTNGAIVEFHLDGPATATSTAVALPNIIDSLRSEGYTFVTVPDMAMPCAPAS